MTPKKKKKVFTEIETDFSAEIRNSKVFSAQKQVVSKKKLKKKKVFTEIETDFSAEIRNSKFFFRPKTGGLQKKRSSLKLRLIFRLVLKIQTFEGGCFRTGGGGYFQFFTKNRPQKHQKRTILHTSQANGGARASPRPPLTTLLHLSYACF